MTSSDVGCETKGQYDRLQKQTNKFHDGQDRLDKHRYTWHPKCMLPVWLFTTYIGYHKGNQCQYQRKGQVSGNIGIAYKGYLSNKIQGQDQKEQAHQKRQIFEITASEKWLRNFIPDKNEYRLQYRLNPFWCLKWV